MKMKDFIDQLKNLKRAGYPVIYIQTFEEKRLEDICVQLFEEVYKWDTIDGIYNLSKDFEETKIHDPVEAIKIAEELPDDSVYIIKDIHAYIKTIDTIRAIKNILEIIKTKAVTLLLVSPIIDIPVELQKEITILEMPLPSEEEIHKLAKLIIKENNLKIPVKEQDTTAAKGLTMFEAENAISYSIVTTKKIEKTVLEKQKLQMIKKSGLLEIYQPVPLEDVGGLDNLKEYLEKRKKGFLDKNLPTPKGILLLGLPGTGKSLFAKATASILQMPLIKLDISQLKSSLLGQSEARLREALKLIDAVSPVVVWIDEIEKMIGGVLSSNRTDGGTTSAMFGYLLTWMQESTTPKYIVATSNDINELLQISQGALIRRFDDVFFVDLPSKEERRTILNIMNRKYNTDIPAQLADKLENWTGAEIEKFVVSSIYHGVDEALKNIKPIFLQNKDIIEKAREWAKHNARMANKTKSSQKVKRVINI